MRFRRWGLTAMAALMLGAVVPPDAARSAVSFGGSYRGENLAVDVSYFYDELAPYGDWMDYGSYGWCWVPNEVQASWRPYSNGHWIYTDYGWTWASYEPWGWAVYHYGRWVFDPMYGWIWIPGTDWGPAWVAWREGYDCIGWAPLPPQVGWSVSFGLEFGDYDYYEAIPYQSWCFVPETRFLDTDLRARVLPIDRVRQMLPRTRDYTRFRSRGGWPINEGVPVSTVERTTGRNIPRLRVTDLRSPGRGHGVVLGRDAVGFFRPRVREGAPRVSPREDARMMQRGRAAERGGLFGGDRARGNRERGGLIDRMWGGGRDRGAMQRPSPGRDQAADRAREMARQRDLDRRGAMERQRVMDRRQNFDRPAREWAPRPERREAPDRDAWQQRPERRQAPREWRPEQGRPERGSWQRQERPAPREWQPRQERQAPREWRPEQGRPERGSWQRQERPAPREWQPRQERPQQNREVRRAPEREPQPSDDGDRGDRGDRGRGNGRGRK